MIIPIYCLLGSKLSDPLTYSPAQKKSLETVLKKALETVLKKALQGSLEKSSQEDVIKFDPRLYTKLSENSSQVSETI